jgi:hypothetical protein
LHFVSCVGIPDYELSVEGSGDAVSVVSTVMHRIHLVQVPLHQLLCRDFDAWGVRDAAARALQCDVHLLFLLFLK